MRTFPFFSKGAKNINQYVRASSTKLNHFYSASYFLLELNQAS